MKINRSRRSTEVIDHEDLREMAIRWLRMSRHCAVVISEMVSSAGEVPDAIGWHMGHSILVECKTSRQDFKQNEFKSFNLSARGMGQQRFFFCKEGLIAPSELTDGWGLITVSSRGGRVKVERESEFREPNLRSEVKILVSSLRRVRAREFISLNLCEHCEPFEDFSAPTTEQISAIFDAPSEVDPK